MLLASNQECNSSEDPGGYAYRTIANKPIRADRLKVLRI